MAKTQEIAAALPGDVIQITAPGPLLMALMIVEEVRRTFTRARMATDKGTLNLGWAEYRVQPGAYAVIGCAAALSAETAKARETMIKTLAGEG